MADDDVGRTHVAQHKRGHLAGVRAFFDFGRAVLRRDLDVRTFEAIADSLQRRKNRSNYDLAVVRVRDQRLQRQRSLNRLADRFVHLPVSGNKRFTHTSISKKDGDENQTQTRSVNASTPGSFSPAKNSSVAPPPVEMCVMRSATPARVTAATESPPPTITTAPRSAASATACAIPIVP